MAKGVQFPVESPLRPYTKSSTESTTKRTRTIVATAHSKSTKNGRSPNHRELKDEVAALTTKSAIVRTFSGARFLALRARGLFHTNGAWAPSPISVYICRRQVTPWERSGCELIPPVA